MNDAQGVRGAGIAWDDLSPCEHLVQFYDSKATLFETLDDFVSSGIEAGDATIVIAVSEHILGLETRMREHGVDLVAARWKGLYIPIDAEDLLAQFMINGMPDEQAFRARIGTILELARQNGRKVRGFGEMVAILWHQGKHEALLRLEALWHAVCLEQSVKLYCAYPSPGDNPRDAQAVHDVCAAHSRVLDGNSRRKTGSDDDLVQAAAA